MFVIFLTHSRVGDPDNVSNFDKEQQLIGIFDKWKSSYIHHTEEIVEAIKKLD